MGMVLPQANSGDWKRFKFVEYHLNAKLLGNGVQATAEVAFIWSLLYHCF